MNEGAIPPAALRAEHAVETLRARVAVQGHPSSPMQGGFVQSWAIMVAP